MDFMTDDCEFRASVGPEPGMTFAGREDVRRGFELMLRYDEAAEGHDGHAFVCGHSGASQWSFSYAQKNGTTVEVRGCDLYEFDGDRIRVKDAYRKVLGPDRQWFGMGIAGVSVTPVTEEQLDKVLPLIASYQHFHRSQTS